MSDQWLLRTIALQSETESCSFTAPLQTFNFPFCDTVTSGLVCCCCDSDAPSATVYTHMASCAKCSHTAIPQMPSPLPLLAVTLLFDCSRRIQPSQVNQSRLNDTAAMSPFACPENRQHPTSCCDRSAMSAFPTTNTSTKDRKRTRLNSSH